MFFGTSCQLTRAAGTVGLPVGVGRAVAESLCGAGPDDAGAGVDPFRVDPSLWVFLEISAINEGKTDGPNRNGIQT